MPEKYTNRLSEIWLKAAVMGSLWASFEIIIGSFLHNLRFPFSGTLLSFASVGLIIAFLQVWKNRGLVWRAGLVAALLKSISPSAIILGPMIGIFTEALIIEVFVLLLGRNLPGYMIGGALAVFSTLLHKVFSLLVTYGFDLIVIVEELYQYISRQAGLTEGDPVIFIFIIVLIYLLAGMSGALLGYLGGRRVKELKSKSKAVSPDQGDSLFSNLPLRKSSPWFLLLHLFCIILCLYMINMIPLWYAAIPSLAYAAYCMRTYKKSMRSFRKVSFWIWFMSITVLAAVFWNGLSKGVIWDWDGLIVGLRMNLRAVIILTGFAAISHELRNPIIRTVLYHNGFANVYHAVELAFSVLPGMIDNLPGIKMLFRKPVSSLASIIKQATEVLPIVRKEMIHQTSVYIITGEIQGGKTTYLNCLVHMLKDHKVKLSGFVATGVHDKDGRIGYDLEDVSTGVRVPYIRNKPSADTIRQGKYYFNAAGLAFGKKILDQINKENTDMIVIDEIGPVELKGKSWADDIERLVRNTTVPHLWVVRKPLLKKVMRHWPIGQIMVADIQQDKPETFLALIMADLNIQ
jgi:nucleoside-triphosphatase THEP1